MEFFDVNVVNETRNKTYERLAKIAGGIGVDEHKILELLTVPERAGENGQLNIGNHVTNDIKLMVKVSTRKHSFGRWIISPNVIILVASCRRGTCVSYGVFQCMILQSNCSTETVY